MLIPKCFYLFGIVTVPLLFSLANDIKSDLGAMQQSLMDKSKRSEVAKALTHFIQFYSDTRQLSVAFLKFSSSNPSNSEMEIYSTHFSISFRLTHEFSHLCRITLLTFGLYYMIGICSDLLLIEMKMVDCLSSLPWIRS